MKMQLRHQWNRRKTARVRPVRHACLMEANLASEGLARACDCPGLCVQGWWPIGSIVLTT